MIPRREFIILLGGAAAWPLTARAQQGDRMRRIGVLMSRVKTEPWQSLLTIFMQGMRKLGWIEGQNLETKAAGAKATRGSARPMRWISWICSNLTCC
jgi:putative ABC transport system substrate-binding protein